MPIFIKILASCTVKEYPKLNSKGLYALQAGMCCVANIEQRASANDIQWIHVFQLSGEEMETSGWFDSIDASGRRCFCQISTAEANQVWDLEMEKRKRLAAAITAMLIRTLTVQKATRFARSLAIHALKFYPGKSLIQTSSTNKKSIEEIMIELGGFSSLNKQQVFDYIKVASCNQSCPPKAIISITEEIQQLMTLRPSIWVTRELNILATEDIRVRNDKFIMTAAEGDLLSFKSMIESGYVELTNLHSELKYTALHAAADFGQVDIISEIIKTGMSLNVKDPRKGQTALHFAAQSARSEVIEVLLQNGADRTIVNNAGLRPFEVADNLGYFDCREMLKYPPPTVKIIQITECTMNSITIEWTTPKIKESIHSPIIEFMVECIPVSLELPVFHITKIHTDKNTVQFNALIPHEFYTISLQARSLSDFVYASKAAVPDVTPLIEILKISINGLWIKWDPPERSNGSPINLYQIELIDYKSFMENANNSHNQSLIDEANGGNCKQVKSNGESNLMNKKKSTDLRTIGSVDKWYRLIIHNHVDDRFKYLAGLEPFRQYVIRVRARNDIGFGPWNQWTRPIAPDMGIKVVEFKPSQLLARVEWFRPILNEAIGRHVERYELQVCHLKGPLVTSIKVLKSKSYRQLKGEANLNFTAAFAKEQELKLQQEKKEDELQRQGSEKSDLLVEEENVNEFITVSDTLSEESYDISLHAGAKYQCRVRVKITGEESFCGWEMSVNSEIFSLAATLPDPPFDVGPAVHVSVLSTNATPETSNAPKKGYDDLLNKVINVTTAKSSIDGDSSHAISAITNTDIIPLTLEQPTFTSNNSNIKIKSSANQKVAKTTTFKDVQVTHDTIVITWKNGNCNGWPVDQFELQCAKIREYRHDDVALATEARGGLAVDGNNSFARSLSIFDDSPLSFSTTNSDDPRIEDGNQLHWLSSLDESRPLNGKYLGPQQYRVVGLTPGAYYIFRMRQHNQLGWSDFSAASAMIQTYPTRPPSTPQLVSVGATYLIVRWAHSGERGHGLTNLEYDVWISTIDSSAVTMSNGGDQMIDDSVYDHCVLHWQSADTKPHEVANTTINASSKLAENVVMIRSLVPGCSYIIRVRVKTLYGWSTWSNISPIFMTLH